MFHSLFLFSILLDTEVFITAFSAIFNCHLLAYCFFIKLLIFSHKSIYTITSIQTRTKAYGVHMGFSTVATLTAKTINTTAYVQFKLNLQYLVKLVQSIPNLNQAYYLNHNYTSVNQVYIISLNGTWDLREQLFSNIDLYNMTRNILIFKSRVSFRRIS